MRNELKVQSTALKYYILKINYNPILSVLRNVVFSKLFVKFIGFGRVKTERIDFLEWTQFLIIYIAAKLTCI